MAGAVLRTRTLEGTPSVECPFPLWLRWGFFSASVQGCQEATGLSREADAAPAGRWPIFLV